MQTAIRANSLFSSILFNRHRIKDALRLTQSNVIMMVEVHSSRICKKTTCSIFPKRLITQGVVPTQKNF